MTVDFDDCMQEIQDVATRSELDDTVGTRRVRNPSLAPNVGRAKLGESTWHAPTYGARACQLK